jgi:hypothetical protein
MEELLLWFPFLSRKPAAASITASSSCDYIKRRIPNN